MTESKNTPKNLEECNEVKRCTDCEYGHLTGIHPYNCDIRLDFVKQRINEIKSIHKEDKYLAYKWFNVKTVGELRESMKLMDNDIEIDIDLRFVENLTTGKKEVQYNHPHKPRNPETLK